MKLEPAQLTALAAILRLGSFEAAAASLNVTASAISQRIKAMEDQVGTTLINRGAPCTGTPLGARLAKHAEDIAVLEAQALGDVTGSDATAPVITLAVPADSLATWLVPALSQVPHLLFDLKIDDQDTADDWLRRGAVSAAVTGHAKAAPGCDIFPLGTLRYIATASPDYMQRHFKNGVTRAALASAPMLTFTPKDQLQTRWITHKTGATLHPPRHQMPSTHAFIDATVQGIAWGMNPEMLVRDHLATGSLQPLDPALPLDTPLYWQVTRVMAPALQELTQAILRASRTHLRPMG